LIIVGVLKKRIRFEASFVLELDEETLTDIMDSFLELYEEIEVDLSQLVEDPSEKRMNNLFRAIHNIKGHASITQVTTVIGLAHSIEDVAESLRSKRYPPSFEICECLQLGMDRLKDLHYRDLLDMPYPNLDEQTIESKFFELSTQPASEVNLYATSFLAYMGGTNCEPDLATMPAGTHIPDKAPELKDELSLKTRSDTEKRFMDLAFFQELSLQLDNQSYFWQNRSLQLYDWAMKINRIGGNLVDHEQLAAASYLHDIGMNFVKNDILIKEAPLTEDELSEVRRHVDWGYNYLVRIPSWEEAAVIILNHHERVDGGGYPNHLTGDLIHPGAKILAVIDAFFSLIKGRADRTHRRTILRAMGEIHACSGTQFDSESVALFTEMIKEESRNGNI